MNIGTVLIIAAAVLFFLYAMWNIANRQSKEFQKQIDRNRGLGLYKSREFKTQKSQLARVQLVSILLLVVLGIPPAFMKLSDAASAMVTILGIILWVAILIARSKWRKLMREGIKE